MALIKSYKRLNKLIQDESFEPLISWGLRMALSGTLPMFWGLATGKVSDAVWITLTAEAVCWVELKGSFSWRVRTLITGAALAMIFSTLGTVTGNNLWLSIAGMLVAGYLATLLKNIGDRASGLGLCVYMLFIICNAYPCKTVPDVTHRIALVAIGASWSVLVGILVSLLTPAEEPFRRQNALIWRSIAVLVTTISKGGAGRSKHEFSDELLQKEKDVRAAMDNSYQFFGRMAHQVSKKNNQQYQLSLLRKIAGLVAVNVIAMGEEMEYIDIPHLDESLRIKAATLFSAMNEAVNRISFFIITLKPEEKLLALSQINRIKKLLTLIREYPMLGDNKQTNAVKRILQLTDRTIKLMESAIQRIDQMGRDVPVYRSYSFIKTLFVLRPQYLYSNLRVLFNTTSHTTRYALRSAIAASLALLFWKLFHIDHGYWLPFSVMIVIQPYFGATFKRGRQRIAGTLMGGIAGSLLLHLPTGLHIKEAILFITFIMMVYYLKKNYAVAVFIITLNLVLLFNLEQAYNDSLMITRALCTIAGSILAIASGYALLPTWDKKWIPSHLADAINCNYEYFKATFYSDKKLAPWTRYKRSAESKNSNVFDSFNRYMDEPGKDKSLSFYDLITYNVRITRDLNNIHLEEDEKKSMQHTTATLSQQTRINECHDQFVIILKILPEYNPNIKLNILSNAKELSTPFTLNEAQIISLEKLMIELNTMQADLEKTPRLSLA